MNSKMDEAIYQASYGQISLFFKQKGEYLTSSPKYFCKINLFLMAKYASYKQTKVPNNTTNTVNNAS